jgi:HD-like signal output (HDOD) protein
MGDDLFKRFRPGTDEDSGQGHRAHGGTCAVNEDAILAAVARVPALPAVVVQLLRSVGRAASSAGDLERLISQDMVITGRLLKLVNSPFYGLANPVGSIQQAVAIIGFSSLKSLVLAASAADVLTVELSAYGFAERGLWRNSVACAALARAIGHEIGLSTEVQEELFAAGLLRDVGILVLGPFLQRAGRTLRRATGDGDGEHDILRREREMIGFDHCWVGERVAERWSLPAPLQAAIARHHRIPAGADEASIRRLAAVRLAERLCYAAGIGVLPDHPFDARIDGVLVHAAGLKPAQFQALVAQVPAIVTSSEAPL